MTPAIQPESPWGTSSTPTTRHWSAAYLLAASICTVIVNDGGPGWLNLLVLWMVWNALKFICMGPVSLMLLVRARFTKRRALTKPLGREGTLHIPVP